MGRLWTPPPCPQDVLKVHQSKGKMILCPKSHFYVPILSRKSCDFEGLDHHMFEMRLAFKNCYFLLLDEVGEDHLRMFGQGMILPPLDHLSIEKVIPGLRHEGSHWGAHEFVLLFESPLLGLVHLPIHNQVDFGDEFAKLVHDGCFFLAFLRPFIYCVVGRAKSLWFGEDGLLVDPRSLHRGLRMQHVRSDPLNFGLVETLKGLEDLSNQRLHLIEGWRALEHRCLDQWVPQTCVS